ncbi:MAG: cation:proton antiporter [archaeon]|nr:cation:proton antiporter [archaeon]
MALLLLIGGICSIIFKRLKMPAAIGYIVSGIILHSCGMQGPDTDNIVKFLSDCGLVLMMFCIGMELNLKKLRKMGSFATMVVMIQVPIMLAGGYLGGTLLGLNALQAIVFGAIISGSSTAVITIVLAEQNRISRMDVETLVLVTVIEDIAQVLIMSAVSPLMQGQEMEITGIIWMLVIVLVFMVAAIGIGMLFIPRLLDYVSEKYADEILLIISLGLCFGLAFLSVKIGMSMAIGAFMMGVIVSQSKQNKRIGHEVEPMKNVFMMMFFVSIGLLINPMDLVNNIPLILAIYLIYFILKAGSVILAYFIGNKPMRLSFYCSISLVAMGEFAFIISKEAYEAGIMSQEFYTSIIGAALISMIFLPLINRKAEAICDFVQVKTPQPIVNGFLRMESIRSSYYTKMSLATKETMRNFRSRLAYAYVNLIIIILIQIIFYAGTPTVTEFIDAHTPETVSRYIATAIVMTLNFVILVPFLYKMCQSIKYLFRVYLDSERKALAAGKGHPHTTVDRFLRYIMSVNNWIFVVLFDFLILFFTPNQIDLIGHIIVAVAGVIIVAILQILAYMRRS